MLNIDHYEIIIQNSWTDRLKQDTHIYSRPTEITIGNITKTSMNDSLDVNNDAKNCQGITWVQSIDDLLKFLARTKLWSINKNYCKTTKVQVE